MGGGGYCAKPERQGSVNYLPLYLAAAATLDAMTWFRAPLFPCYLFVAIDVASQRWRSIQSTFGVAQLFAGDILRRPRCNCR